ncbi:MAG TPA: amidohydrolase family protein [Bryobacteraceae bacterium]|nr:amidohydrolase family protein [Bryobacteraceae bacterium]
MAHLLLRGAKQLLTLRGPRGVRRGVALRELGIITDGSVLVRDGRIVEVGSTRRIENLKEARDAIEIFADGRILVPGFVDASLSLKVETDESNGGKSFHKRKSIINFHEGSLGLLRACLQHGTLTADVKASGGERYRSLDLPALRKLADIGSNPISTVRTWHVGHTPESQADENLLSILATLDRRRLIHFIEFSGESGHAIDLQLLSRVVDSNIGIKLAWPGGLEDELLRCLQQFCPAAVYCPAPIFLTAEETAVLAASSSIAVLGAGKEVFEGPISRIGRDLVDAGAAVALSSGYDSSSAASFSMQMSISLAVVRLGLTVEEAFSAATINAAYAAGCGDRIGSIEIGKKADMLLLNASDYRDVPNQFGVNHVDMVIRDGNVVLNRTRWKAMTS